MYRRNLLFSTLFKTNLNGKLTAKLSKRSDPGRSLRCLNLKLISQQRHQHIRCLCNTESHRKTLHSGHDRQQHDYRSFSKSSWMMVAGAGLFSYSVWKARHQLQDLRNQFTVYALDDEKDDKDSSTDKTETKAQEPTTPNDQVIPSYVPYLLIGAGTASHSAMRAIRLRDHKAQVLIVGDEDNNPYSRPPLSKELWYGEQTGIFYDPKDFYGIPEDLPSTKYGGVAVLQNRKVIKLNTEDRIAFLDNGSEIKYDKCLIATGGRPKNLPVFENASKAVQSRVHLFRNINDFVRLHTIAHTRKSIAIIGGGFLGSELACGLAHKGHNRGLTNLKVYQIFPEKGVMSQVLPDYLSKYTTEKIKEEGVDVVSEKSVKEAKYKDKQVVLTLSDGSQIKVDDVVVTVGLQPNDDIAKTSELDIDPMRGGVMANAELEAKPNIWAAGDVASFYDYKYGRCRVEHHNTADSMGKLAGQNMAGARKLYEHKPYFWSDLGAESYQAIGEVASSLETFSIFTPLKDKTLKEHSSQQDGIKNSNNSSQTANPPALKSTEDYQGVVFYYKDKQIVGIVLWNVFGRGKVSTCRQILEKSKEIRSEDPYELSKLLFRSYKPSKPKIDNKQETSEEKS
ncbi:apoptosis-inducing factor 1, mitochondrial-like [Mytilus californianus]|uniref:apoptosis-inducing factor 1, mitochondrial-like n=1 Tax=Mytilus californianus TaxID=6549 RepID=UPI002247BFB8|nr:apoptosis-inducing factor 1, mitochondrial-like [Mytilus californianus]